MARTRDQDRFDDKRDRILAEAAKVFSSKGFRGATMDDVADGLGLTKGSLYYYFKNKDDLLYEICDATMDEALLYVREITSDTSMDASEQLQELVSRHIDFMARQADAFTVFFHELGARDSPKAREIRRKQREFATCIEDTVQGAMASGEFRELAPTRLVVLAILGMCNWSHMWLRHEPWDAPQIAAVFSDLLYAGLVNCEGSSPDST